MNNEQMREEFEEWAAKGCGRLSRENSPDSDTHGYQDSHTNLCWQAWQASRAALCVELPEEEEHKGVYYDIDYMPTDAVLAAIHAAGVKTRGGETIGN
jgi:hypothetical protein